MDWTTAGGQGCEARGLALVALPLRAAPLRAGHRGRLRVERVDAIVLIDPIARTHSRSTLQAFRRRGSAEYAAPFRGDGLLSLWPSTPAWLGQTQ